MAESLGGETGRRAVGVVLASGSPRRLELVRRLGIEPEVRPADIDETPRRNEDPSTLVRRLARSKATAVARPSDNLVVAADTVVVHDGAILGKPTDARDACAMLQHLSGSTHQVLTGLHVLRGSRRAEVVETTLVHVRALGDVEIDAYVATGEPMDKAGAYAIQGAGGMFVTGIEGSDTNVVGLPLAALVHLAAAVGVELLPG